MPFAFYLLPLLMPQHIPVLVREAIAFLDLSGGERIIDANLGLGGHAGVILDKIGRNGRLLGIDRDAQALAEAQRNLAAYHDQVTFVHNHFSQLSEIALSNNFAEVDGILFDLGLSSWQLATTGRGFSFQRDELLDMRMDQSRGLTAAELLHASTESELQRIFQDFGEEPFARPIAAAIARQEKISRINRTQELVKVILSAVPKKYHHGRIHPATRVFQALRIAVNDELNELKKVLPQALTVLKHKGRLVIISFHSLEDRIVKDFFKQESKDCICPPELPVCRCQHRARVTILTKKPVTPTAEELENNPRARSAKMRAVQKI